MARELPKKNLGLGIHTIPSDAELIPPQSSQDSLGWISTDGKIELCRGKLLLGTEETTTSYSQGEGWGYKANGTSVHFRKTDTKIQYYNTTTSLWVDIVTGLTANAEYTFSPYRSTAGTFMYATGIDGVFKMHTANLPSYNTMYTSTGTYVGRSAIYGNRMFMWNLPTSKTGLYGSRLDGMEFISGNYTTVTAEATTSLTGTLAFKAGDAKRNCFNVVITLTGTGEVYRESQDGILTGSLGGTGTINYISGAYTMSNAGVGTADYKWEMSNTKGVTDFSSSATRVASEGFILNQGEGGDSIESVREYNGTFLSIKTNSVYELTIDVTDLTFSNKIFRRNIGMPYWRAAVSTGKGVFFMDTSNLDKPRLTLIQRNPIGDNLEPFVVAEHFDFSNYVWDNCAMETFGEYIVFSGKTQGAARNDVLFMYNLRQNTVDVLPYAAKIITQNSGLLYIGDTLTFNSYNILSGFDDDGSEIQNHWISNDEMYGSEKLKKVKRFRIKGIITADQSIKIYDSYDGGDFTLAGTVLGNGTYVDYGSSYSIGSNGIGTTPIGGEADYTVGNFYLAEIKVASPKFRKRTVKLVAGGIGYVSVHMIDDFNIMSFEQRLPSKYRSKQNVSRDGTLTDQ